MFTCHKCKIKYKNENKCDRLSGYLDKTLCNDCTKKLDELMCVLTKLYIKDNNKYYTIRKW